MSKYTDRLGLFMWDLEDDDDLNSNFDLTKSLYNNWELIDTAIGTNIDNIETNTTNIETNTTNISTNTADIATLEGQVETNANSIVTLETNVSTNTSNIETLQTSVNTNAENISTLQTSVETNIEDIETLEEQVATNTTNIATNATSITAIEEKNTEQDESITSLNTSVNTNTSSIKELQETVGTGFYSMIAKNAGAHNSVYRGEDITDLFYDGTLTTEIAAGTFDDIFIGDYITGASSGLKYLVADINYRYSCGDTSTSKNHVLMIPDLCMGKAQMNSTDTTEGAYVGSEMYTTNLEEFKTIIQNDFEDGHILTHENYFANGVTDAYESGKEWVSADIDLMNELMVYGSDIYHNSRNGTSAANNSTIDKSQLSLFRLDKSHIVAYYSSSRQNYWLRDVISSSNFAYVSGYGNASTNAASSSNGVRPAFLIY